MPKLHHRRTNLRSMAPRRTPGPALKKARRFPPEPRLEDQPHLAHHWLSLAPSVPTIGHWEHDGKRKPRPPPHPCPEHPIFPVPALPENVRGAQFAHHSMASRHCAWDSGIMSAKQVVHYHIVALRLRREHRLQTTESPGDAEVAALAQKLDEADFYVPTEVLEKIRRWGVRQAVREHFVEGSFTTEEFYNFVVFEARAAPFSENWQDYASASKRPHVQALAEADALQSLQHTPSARFYLYNKGEYRRGSAGARGLRYAATAAASRAFSSRFAPVVGSHVLLPFYFNYAQAFHYYALALALIEVVEEILPAPRPLPVLPEHTALRVEANEFQWHRRQDPRVQLVDDLAAALSICATSKKARRLYAAGVRRTYPNGYRTPPKYTYQSIPNVARSERTGLGSMKDLHHRTLEGRAPEVNMLLDVMAVLNEVDKVFIDLVGLDAYASHRQTVRDCLMTATLIYLGPEIGRPMADWCSNARRTGFVKRRWFCDCEGEVEEDCPHSCWWPGNSPTQAPAVLTPISMLEGLKRSTFGLFDLDKPEELALFHDFVAHVYYPQAESGLRMARGHLVPNATASEAKQEELGLRYAQAGKMLSLWGQAMSNEVFEYAAKRDRLISKGASASPSLLYRFHDTVIEDVRCSGRMLEEPFSTLEDHEYDDDEEEEEEEQQTPPKKEKEQPEKPEPLPLPSLAMVTLRAKAVSSLRNSISSIRSVLDVPYDPLAVWRASEDKRRQASLQSGSVPSMFEPSTPPPPPPHEQFVFDFSLPHRSTTTREVTYHRSVAWHGELEVRPLRDEVAVGRHCYLSSVHCDRVVWSVMGRYY